MELDPVFLRGLRLLHSRSRDSADQLRALLDEVRLRSGRTGGKLSPANMSPRSTPGLGRAADAGLKRGLDKIKDDLGDMNIKRARVDSPVGFKSHTPSPTMSRDSDASKKSEDSDLNDTAGLEMDFMVQLACVVCRNIGVSTGNQLIECQECGSLYHQECHRPAITEQERGDTRAVWLCANCKEQQAAGSAAQSAGSGGSSSRPGPGASLLKSKASTKSLGSLHLSKSSGQGGPPTAKTQLTSKSTAGSRPPPFSPSAGKAAGGAAPPPNSMVSAERRMQLMKKKAAAKLNEKRKN
ncbi:integrator complex subunit 12-like isoform X2 [Pollicipes pollicipes]|uniref:integrator complex subunit 12-like isoform X2 n=1 Tax=Pollicipes pollicipes TaxID=41117 RepID=UPI001885294E|nr:integrator complex subunit 12-like isoform X2 [Pollicipes pollicipes]XP_037071633.1 integrator complex subunit 12-like isoform X2 [Pollicipes pollicipes]